MNNSSVNFIKVLLIIMAILSLISLCQYLPGCQKQPEPVTPAKSEETRQQIEKDNELQTALFEQQAAFEQRILKAIDERLQQSEHKDSQATEKALQSALKYAKQPTLENCNHALQDCQHENQAKAEVIGAQSEKISSLARTVKADSVELNRRQMVIGLYNTNLKDANTRWQQTEQQLLKAKKPKPWGLGLQFGYGFSDGFQPKPYVGGGVSYNFVRF